MAFKKSPGGSLFPYPYKGGELFGLHFGSFGGNEDALVSLMKAEANFFVEQCHSMGIWIDFYETNLTDKVIIGFGEFLRHTCRRVHKLGLVGCSSADQRKLNQLIKDEGCFEDIPVKYFCDPEDAKTWLVSERG
jgi:hypothetical protein